jgi:hypothetical protein
MQFWMQRLCLDAAQSSNEELKMQVPLGGLGLVETRIRILSVLLLKHRAGVAVGHRDCLEDGQ